MHDKLTASLREIETAVDSTVQAASYLLRSGALVPGPDGTTRIEQDLEARLAEVVGQSEGRFDSREELEAAFKAARGGSLAARRPLAPHTVQAALTATVTASIAMAVIAEIGDPSDVEVSLAMADEGSLLNAARAAGEQIKRRARDYARVTAGYVDTGYDEDNRSSMLFQSSGILNRDGRMAESFIAAMRDTELLRATTWRVEEMLNRLIVETLTSSELEARGLPVARVAARQAVEQAPERAPADSRPGRTAGW